MGGRWQGQGKGCEEAVARPRQRRWQGGGRPRKGGRKAAKFQGKTLEGSGRSNKKEGRWKAAKLHGKTLKGQKQGAVEGSETSRKGAGRSKTRVGQWKAAKLQGKTLEGQNKGAAVEGQRNSKKGGGRTCSRRKPFIMPQPVTVWPALGGGAVATETLNALTPARGVTILNHIEDRRQRWRQGGRKGGIHGKSEAVRK